MLWFSVDLDELPTLDRDVALFRYNRRAPFSLRDADYAGTGPGDVRAKIIALLRRHTVTDPIGRIVLTTLPRVFGYAFNPVSFFRCHRPDGSLSTLVAEVRNTMGEAHHYVLTPEPHIAPGQPVRFICDKTFYVSPFLQVRGDYEVLVRDAGNELFIQINLRQAGELVFSADMTGIGTPLDSRGLRAVALRLPWLVCTVMTRITWQAVLLYVRRKLPVYEKPNPTDAATYDVGRSKLWQRIRTAAARLASGRANPRTADPVLAMQKESL